MVHERIEVVCWPEEVQGINETVEAHDAHTDIALGHLRNQLLKSSVDSVIEGPLGHAFAEK